MIKKVSSKSNKVIKRETLKLFSFDLKKKIPIIEPRISIQIEISTRPLELDNAQFETVKSRIESGNRIFIARYRSKVVGYLFAATSECEVGEIEDMLVIHGGEVYLYDAFTVAGFRGNWIYPALLSTACEYFKEKEFSFALIFTSESNSNSIKGIERCEFSCYEVVRFTNKFGEKSWNYSLRSYDVQSHFAHEDR